MTFVVNWKGDPIETSSIENERTNKAGLFKSAVGITTYFPLPNSFNVLVPVVGMYKVPAAFSNRPDLIAKELYKDSDLWWIIFWSNSIVDPFVGPIAGDLIKIIDILKFRQLFNK